MLSWCSCIVSQTIWGKPQWKSLDLDNSSQWQGTKSSLTPLKGGGGGGGGGSTLLTCIIQLEVQLLLFLLLTNLLHTVSLRLGFERGFGLKLWFWSQASGRFRCCELQRTRAWLYTVGRILSYHVKAYNKLERTQKGLQLLKSSDRTKTPVSWEGGGRGMASLRYTLSQGIIDFPRYKMKCSGENVIQCGIVHVVSCFPLHSMLYRGNLDCFSNSVYRVPSKPQFGEWETPVPGKCGGRVE